MRIAFIPEKGMRPEVYTAIGAYIKTKTGMHVDYFTDKMDALSNNGHVSLLTMHYDRIVTGTFSGADIMKRIRQNENPNTNTPVVVLKHKNMLTSSEIENYTSESDCCITYPVDNRAEYKNFTSALPKNPILDG